MAWAEQPGWLARDLPWAVQLGEPRQWGIEGASNYGRGLAQCLIAAGETVYEINPRWTATGRRQARNQSRSDPLDAQAIALLVWREADQLPRVGADDQTVLLDLLVTERETAQAEAVHLRGHLHALLLQIDPQYADHLPVLVGQKGLAAVLVYDNTESPLKRERAAAVRRTAQRLQLAVDQVAELTTRIKDLALAAGLEPLTRLCGVNLLTAAALAGILGPGLRFSSDAHLASYAGAAPLETSSAGTVRHRLNRGGQSSVERDSAPDCRDTSSTCARCTRLPGPASHWRQEHARSIPCSQAIPRSPNLAPLARLRC